MIGFNGFLFGLTFNVGGVGLFGWSVGLWLLGVVPFVGLYYALYQLVAHNVFFAELHTAYAGHAFEYFKSLYQTARCGAR